MDDLCRLCCSTKFVNNDIFDEENALYLKMSLYLPIKVLKNDRLPQKICDKCSCKVNDFYQFCNETIEVQNRLRGLLLASGIAATESVNLSHIKQDFTSPAPVLGNSQSEQGTQTDCTTTKNGNPDYNFTVEVKKEYVPSSPTSVKKEEVALDSDHCDISNDIPTDSSEDMSLVKLSKKKRKADVLNGANENKRGRKKKEKSKNWDLSMNSLSAGTTLTVVNNEKVAMVDLKQERGMQHQEFEVSVKVKTEPLDDLYSCCICFSQCYSKTEMLQHYKGHAVPAEGEGAAPEPPAPPPPPSDIDPLRCTRCSKALERSQWARHWRRHWERDTRPYRCALCEKTFRDHRQILKHGATHKPPEDGGEARGPDKRFVCDLCPEEFVYMRYLLAHRTRSHPEAAARALSLRCARCQRTFAHLNSLRRHLRAHSGERNFLCNVCGKALSSREHLKFHIRIHTGHKPNVCKTCGKGFVKKCNLTLHERVHSGEKPHVCSHCGKAFSQRSTLVIHERYHSGARPYVCSLCGRGFVAKGLLSMHLKTTCI